MCFIFPNVQTRISICHLSQNRGRNKIQLPLCQHSVSLSLPLSLMSVPASAVMFFASSSWNEWTLLQLCGKLAGEILHSATPALSFYKCIMHFLSSSAHCKKEKKKKKKNKNQPKSAYLIEKEECENGGHCLHL